MLGQINPLGLCVSAGQRQYLLHSHHLELVGKLQHEFKGNLRTSDINCCVCYSQSDIMDVSQSKSDTGNVPGIKTLLKRPIFPTNPVNCSQMWPVMLLFNSAQTV